MMYLTWNYYVLGFFFFFWVAGNVLYGLEIYSREGKARGSV